MRKAAIFIVGMMIIFFSCKKNDLSNDPSEMSLVENAKSFFNKAYTNAGQVSIQTNSTTTHLSPRLKGPRTVQWDQAYIFQKGKSKAILAPIQYSSYFYVQSNFGGNAVYAINDIARLCVFRDSLGVFHAEMLSFFPDSNYQIKKPFTGIAFVDDWLGGPIMKYKFEKDGSILKWDGDIPMAQQTRVQTESVQSVNGLITETCLTIYGYNYSVDNPNGGYYWSESGGCTYSVDESFADLGGRFGSTGLGIGAIGASRGISPANTVIVTGGNNIIGSISDYDKCFTNLGGTDHVFTVTVCVDQPSPGTRKSWGLSGTGSSASGNPVDAGHAFLVLTEISPSGTITRNVGFYPKVNVTPSSSSAQGQLNNDANHIYDISLSITMTNAQFFEILNYIAQGNNSGFDYNLNTNNCTSFIINALDQASIYLPSTIGTWFNGSGNDPGDLGEDIRGMNLSSNMARNTAYNYHPNLGTCN